jgi:two-component system response regulator DesR
MLVEPVRLLRNALSAVLSAEDDIQVVAEIPAVDRVAAVDAGCSDLVILGLEPKSPDGPELLRQLRVHVPDRRILVLTCREGAHRLRRALGSRALRTMVHGLVDKDTTPRQLVRYIHDVSEGQRVVDPRLLPSLTPRDNPLTPREREVLALAALGMPTTEIAHDLKVGTGTVRTYLSTIIRKTGARTAVDAIGIARRAGWL